MEFSGCDTELERREEGSWIEVPRRPEGAVCVGGVHMLTPGGEYAARQIIFDWISSGKYRFRFPFSYQSSNEKRIIFSNQFFIER